jgi:pimeloyl-ACP methyl ester carboxylesterase
MTVKVKRVVIISVDFLGILSLLDDLTFYKDFSLKLPNGVWQWWINCSNGDSSTASEKRSITIDVFRGDKTFTSTLDGSSRTYWLDLPDDFDNSTPTPLVIFLHGYGGSRMSYPTKYPSLRQTFQSNTWIVASVDCRNVSDGSQIYQDWYIEPSRRDITNVISLIMSDYNVDVDHVHVMGNSMGGSGALKYAMFNNQVIASLVDIHGVADFTQFYSENSYYRASLRAAYGGRPADVPEVYADESALGNEERFSHTPVMILHGTADGTVAVSHSRYLNESLSALGCTVEYVEVPGVGHDAAVLMSGREMDILNWFKDHPLFSGGAPSDYAVHLLLTVDPSRGDYSNGEVLTYSVTVFNEGLDLDSSLTLTVTGPGNYGFYDMQPVNVAAGTFREYSFGWTVPNAAGTYVAEVGLAPAQLTAYDATWLKVS